MSFTPIHNLKLYRNLKAFEPADSYNIVRFYQHYEADLMHLDFDEMFDSKVIFANALHRCGSFEHFIDEADQLLEIIIKNNLVFFKGEDIYHQILLSKAGALLELGRYQSAEHILRELIKMSPWDKKSARLYTQCQLKQRAPWLLHIRAVTAIMLLLTAVVLGIEILVLNHFVKHWMPAAELLHIVLFAGGFLLLGLGEGLHAYLCHRNTDQMVSEMLKQKNVQKTFRPK